MTSSKADTESARTFDDSENEDTRSSIESAASTASRTSNETYWDGLETDCDIARVEKCLKVATECILLIKTRRKRHSETSEDEIV
jgi:hypothetical protein